VETEGTPLFVSILMAVVLDTHYLYDINTLILLYDSILIL